MDRRVMIAVAAAIGVLGFGGGALTMRMADSYGWFGPKSAAGAVAQADQGLPWPFFGKPRSASAGRAPPAKPDGFAVWTQRIDTSRPDAQACVRMSRPLDAGKSYSDYVLVSPDLGHPPAVTPPRSRRSCQSRRRRSRRNWCSAPPASSPGPAPPRGSVRGSPG